MDRLKNLPALWAATILGFAVGFLASWLIERKSETGNVSTLDSQIAALEQAYQTMARERSVVKPTIEREVIMFTRDHCVWCDKWMREESQRFRDLGYQIATCKDHSFNPVPQFELRIGEEKKHYAKYITAAEFSR